jgi:ADP-heptose:LPS heptosyltransferase
MSGQDTRVLVIRVGRLGDTVMATSILEPLVRHFGARLVIDWVAGSGASAEILNIDTRIHRVFILKHRRRPAWLDRVKRELKRLSSEQPYDALVNLEFGDTCDELATAITARQKYGRPYFLHKPPEHRHGIDQMKVFYRDLVGAENLQHTRPSLKPATEPEPLPEPLATTSFILVHPGFSAVKRKNYRLNKAWPMPYWKSLISHITLNRECLVVITGTKSEEPYLRELIQMDHTFPMIGRSLRQLTLAMQKARCVVSVDTGTMHISAALGTPTIALFGPTDPAMTGPHPTSTNLMTLTSDVECRPCYGTPLRKKCTFNRCMHELKPETVLNKVVETLHTVNETDDIRQR